MKLLKVLFGLGFLAVAGAGGYALLFYGPFLTPTYGDPAPVQPINFPHNRHAGTDAAAGQLGLPCTMCHIYAETSEQAGAPPLQLCMACHAGIGLDKPGVQKLHEYVNKGQSVEWVRVHQLPNFIRFTHKRHVKAGIQCQECHGPVETMAVLTRVAPLKMGWCLDCHAKNEVKFEGLGQTPELAHITGTHDCWTCHK